jgi:hypothetical protein
MAGSLPGGRLPFDFYMKKLGVSVLISLALLTGIFMILTPGDAAASSCSSVELPSHHTQGVTITPGLGMTRTRATCGMPVVEGPCVATCIGTPWDSMTYLYAYPITSVIALYEPLSGDFYLYRLPNVVHLNTSLYEPPISDGWSKGGFWVSAPPSGTVRAIVFQASQGAAGGPPYDWSYLTFKRMEGEPCAGGGATCELWPSTSADLGVRRVCVEGSVLTEYCDLVDAERVGTQFYPPTPGNDNKYVGFECGWNLDGYECDAYNFYFIVEMPPGIQPPNPDPITPSLDLMCTISQPITFDPGGLVMGQIVAQRDWGPVGLYPFVGGTFRSLVPISSAVLRYEFYPFMRKDSETFLVRDNEYHAVKWAAIDFTGIISMPVCTEPVLVEECPELKIATWRIGNWFVWLWCHLRAWFAYFVDYWVYLICLVYQINVSIINALAEFLFNINVDWGAYFSSLSILLFSFFSQLGDFLAMCVREIPPWLSEGFSWASAWINATFPGFAAFLLMAITEGGPWLSWLLTWFATDFVFATFGAILQTLATVINNSSQLMQFVVNQFATSILDAVNMVGYLVEMIAFVITLLSDLIAGLNAALGSETEANLFSSVTPFFWSGLGFFEEIASGTPLVLLNLVAIGLIGVNLIWWTIGQFGEMVDDLMSV